MHSDFRSLDAKLVKSPRFFRKDFANSCDRRVCNVEKSTKGKILAPISRGFRGVVILFREILAHVDFFFLPPEKRKKKREREKSTERESNEHISHNFIARKIAPILNPKNVSN